jgi:hypothetical protein
MVLPLGDVDHLGKELLCDFEALGHEIMSRFKEPGHQPLPGLCFKWCPSRAAQFGLERFRG